MSQKKAPDKSSTGRIWVHHLEAMPPDFQKWKLAQYESLDKRARRFQFRVHRHRSMWTDLSAVLEARDPRCRWTRHYDALYIDSQIVALTRICYSTGTNSVSLSELLDAVRSRPELRVHLGGSQVKAGYEKTLNPKKDKSLIRNAVSRLEPWRNQFVVHISRNPRPPDFSWLYLEDAIMTLTEVFKMLAFRITGAHNEVDGSHGTGWRKVFADGLYEHRRLAADVASGFAHRTAWPRVEGHGRIADEERFRTYNSELHREVLRTVIRGFLKTSCPRSPDSRSTHRKTGLASQGPAGATGYFPEIGETAREVGHGIGRGIRNVQK